MGHYKTWSARPHGHHRPPTQTQCRQCTAAFWKEMHQGLPPPWTSHAARHTHAPGSAVCSRRSPCEALTFLLSLFCVGLLSSGLVNLPLALCIPVGKNGILGAGTFVCAHVCVRECVCVCACTCAFASPLRLGVCISCGKILHGEKLQSLRRNVLEWLGFSPTGLSLLILESTLAGGGGILEQKGRGKRGCQG